MHLHAHQARPRVISRPVLTPQRASETERQATNVSLSTIAKDAKGKAESAAEKVQELETTVQDLVKRLAKEESERKATESRLVALEARMASLKESLDMATARLSSAEIQVTHMPAHWPAHT